MPIPAFDHRGLLPEGVHDADNWRAVEGAFAFNPYRAELLVRMREFIRVELDLVASGLDLVIGGSFVTSKDHPGDIDCTVLFPVDQIQARGAAFQLLMQDGRKGRIWQTYRVEVYPTICTPGASDFTEFFQYVGEKSAIIHKCSPADKRGVIKVRSWTTG
jgi:hypothetical protein